MDFKSATNFSKENHSPLEDEGKQIIGQFHTYPIIEVMNGLMLLVIGRHNGEEIQLVICYQESLNRLKNSIIKYLKLRISLC